MPQIYRVTDPGARLAEVDLPPPRNDLSRLHHTLEVLELSYYLRTLDDDVEQFLTERELRRDKLIARREKETGRMRPGGKMGRTPDGLLILGDTQEVALELELSPKRAVNYRRIFTDYERQVSIGELDGIRFYFTSKKALNRVQELSQRHDLDGCLNFYHYEPAFERRR